jgi:transcription initiation factor IIE alpha subunit
MELENVKKVWHAALNPTGFSISHLSSLTEIKRSEVEKIVAELRDQDLIEEKIRYKPHNFTGYVSIGDISEFELDEEKAEV